MISKIIVLTFDLEDWFHILDNESTKSINEWQHYPSRILENTDKIVTLLEQNNLKATFFCLGWIAKKHPEIIKHISNFGHEIACHSNLHQLVYNQTPADFRKDTETSIKTLEDIIGKKVISYRAPGFSITEETRWAFEILAELGIERDSSVFPASRAHGGYPTFASSQPCLILVNGATIKEFPISYSSFLGNKLVYAGGGYFRLLPYFYIEAQMKQCNYSMTYFHPRDFDPEQPIVPGLSRIRRFKSYVGLKSSYNKLDRLLKKFQFIDLDTADQRIDWQHVKKICLV